MVGPGEPHHQLCIYRGRLHHLHGTRPRMAASNVQVNTMKTHTAAQQHGGMGARHKVESGTTNLQHVQERFEGQREHLAPSRHVIVREELQEP